MFTLLCGTGALSASAFAATLWVPGSWKAVTMGIWLAAALAGLGEAIAIVVSAQAPPRRPRALRNPKPVVVEAAKHEEPRQRAEGPIDVLAGVPAM
ncbi:MAG TPA: hypothetical protein VF032_06430 [Thermoleophilaceae bacterium]